MESLSEEFATQAVEMLEGAWDSLRALQGNKTASILRYLITGEGKPHLGIGPTKTLVPDLSDLDVYVNQVSVREVIASNGKIELTDLLFVFWNEIKMTDKIEYLSKVYRVIQVRYYDPDIGQCQIVARAI